MKKTLFYSLIIFTLLIQNRLYSQFEIQWGSEQLLQANIYKTKFINENLGYIAVYDSPQSKSRLYKTTDRGNFWTEIWNAEDDQYFTFEIIGTHLHVYHQMKVWRSTNEGQTWYGNSFDMTGIVGTAPSEQVVIEFYNQSVGYITYVNSDYYPKLYIFKTSDEGQSWQQVYTLGGSNPFIYGINDFAFIENDQNHVMFVGYIQLQYQERRKGSIIVETLDGFNTAPGYQQNYTGGEDCFCNNTVSFLPNHPINQIRIILSKYKYSNNSHPDNGTYCRIGTTDYKISNLYDPILFGGVSFSDNIIGYTYIHENIYKTTNSGVNWELAKDNLPLGYYSKFKIHSFGDIVYAFSHNGYKIRKYISSNIRTVKELQEEFNGSFLLNGENKNTPFNKYLLGGDNTFSANPCENKIFYKWNDGDMNNNRVIKVLYDNFNLIANYKTNGVADNENAIANPNLTKSLRDTNGTINRIYESIGGIFYSRSTDNGETFSNEQIVNNGGEAVGNFNSFISEIKPHGDFNVDPVGNMVVVWQRREGNNEVIKIA